MKNNADASRLIQNRPAVSQMCWTQSSDKKKRKKKKKQKKKSQMDHLMLLVVFIEHRVERVPAAAVVAACFSQVHPSAAHQWVPQGFKICF